MNQELQRVYRKVREAGVACIVGENAKLSLDTARTIMQWDALESAGFVRVKVQNDPDPDFSYLDTWEHVSEQTRERLLEEWADNTVIVSCQWRISEDDRWHTGDSIGGCTGYDDPASPFENCYVSGMMQTTIEQFRYALRSRFCRQCSHKVA